MIYRRINFLLLRLPRNYIREKRKAFCCVITEALMQGKVSLHHVVSNRTVHALHLRESTFHHQCRPLKDCSESHQHSSTRPHQLYTEGTQKPLAV